MIAVDPLSHTDARRGDALADRVTSYPLVKALLERRSRRFARGMTLDGGPLQYESTMPPRPLSLEEEAALAFAACGITGDITGEMPYQTGTAAEDGTGYVLTHFGGRTVGSADSVHAVALFVINDDGAWLLKRPQDHPRAEIPELAAAGREHRFVELYEKNRIRIADHRLDVPRDTQVLMPFNKWSANVAGSTYYVPVAEMTSLYINVMLMLFDEDLACTVIDEQNGFRPAGVAKFTRGKGGYLHDDPSTGRYLLTVGYVESVLSELTTIEQGMMLQNLALMGEALGVGGFPHFAAHPFAWLQTLGFKMQVLPFTRTVGASRLTQLMAKLLKKEQPFPTALGLERDGEVLMKPFCPPYYRNMEEAVLAFLDQKYAPGTGSYRDGRGTGLWKDGARVQAGIGRYSQRAVEATIAYCDYVYRRYGRFPAAYGAFHTVLAHQAHHVDSAFYDRFYRPETLSPLHRRHE
jgi:hypothetical protein